MQMNRFKLLQKLFMNVNPVSFAIKDVCIHDLSQNLEKGVLMGGQ